MKEKQTKAQNYQEFEFVVEDMNEAQANELFDLILGYVEEHGLSMGGGCYPTTDLDYPSFLFTIERFASWLVRIWKKVHHGET